MSEEETQEREEQEEDEKAEAEEQDEDSGSDDTGSDDDSSDEEDSDGDGEDGKSLDDEYEEAKQEVKDLEEDPPEKLEDWPKGKALYETFGGAEGDHGYHEGPEENLGPSSLRHREDGTVEIAGDEVDDPEEDKGDPIPGGPT